MAIPDYQSHMLPVLTLAGDAQEHRIGDVTSKLAHELDMTEEEREQMLPSGRATTFGNRVHWAKTYLLQAGLLQATKRGHFKITKRGRDALSNAPDHIDNEYLSRFPEFQAFRERSRGSQKHALPLPPIAPRSLSD